jgi:multiple sugar transport system ATP-binding protein
MTMGDRVAVMRKGEIQQVDDPQTLYDRPRNLFVGGFIGSPAMNMLEATLEKEGDNVVCRVGSTTLTLPEAVLSARPALLGYAGRPIALGIRPEALDDSGGRNGDGGRLRGVVRAIEALGPELLAHVEVEAKPVLVEDVVEGLVDMEEADDLAEIRTDTDGDRAMLVARLAASASVRPDETVELAVDLRNLHFFDLGTGATIGA